MSRFWPALAAAAFVAGILLPIRPDGTQPSTAPLYALVNSHFVHAAFTPLSADAPKAKVLFARSRAWLYLIAETRRPLAVGLRRGGALQTLGNLVPHDGIATLFVNEPGKPGEIVLFDAKRPVAQVKF